MRCDTCLFFFRPEEPRETEAGFCRRYPPTVSIISAGGKCIERQYPAQLRNGLKERMYDRSMEPIIHRVVAYPYVEPDGFCGEYQSDEQKVTSKVVNIQEGHHG